MEDGETGTFAYGRPASVYQRELESGRGAERVAAVREKASWWTQKWDWAPRIGEKRAHEAHDIRDRGAVHQQD